MLGTFKMFNALVRFGDSCAGLQLKKKLRML
jgi:hypothetical protein